MEKTCASFVLAVLVVAILIPNGYNAAKSVETGIQPKKGKANIKESHELFKCFSDYYKNF